MLFKDKALLEEAYLSTTGKIPSTPADKEEEVEDNNSNAEDIDTGIETSEEPMVIAIGGPVDSEEEENEAPESVGGDTSSWQEHENEEIRMAKTNLFTLSEDAKLLHDCIHEGEVIEPWMLQKIAVASEMLCGVAKVVRYYTAKKAAGE
jgi:hypothetical protein